MMNKSKTMLFIAPALFSVAPRCTGLQCNPAIQDVNKAIFFMDVRWNIYAGFTLMVNVLSGGNAV